MDINAVLSQIDSEIQNVGSSEALEEFRLRHAGNR